MMAAEAKGRKGAAVDLRRMYRSDPETTTTDMTVVRYSNLAYVQVSPRDVYIDFLEMPGVVRDGRTTVNGTRIYMSHVAAERLGEVLRGVLAKAASDGAVEQLRPKR